jgi:hypothetical protein
VTVKDDEIRLIQEQLAGLAKAVQSDLNFAVNKEDYLVTVNSLKNRLEKAKLTGDPPMAGTQTGRTPRKQRKIDNMTPEQQEAATKAMNQFVRPPMTNRRAAIEHTRKLNESNNDS